MRRIPLTFLLLGLGAFPTRAEAQVITSVTLSSSSVTGGTSVTGTITLSENAGQGGRAWKPESSNSALATVPPGVVVVQEGTRTATFVVQTKPVAGNPNVVADPPFVDITVWTWIPGRPPASASHPAPPSKSVRLIVRPAALASLTLSPSSVSGGTAATASVQLTGPAPAGGFTLTLTSKLTGADPAPRVISPGIKSPVVSVPAQVTIPAGATAATFQVTTRQVTAATPAQVTASYGVFNTKTATLTITP